MIIDAIARSQMSDVLVISESEFTATLSAHFEFCDHRISYTLVRSFTELQSDEKYSEEITL